MKRKDLIEKTESWGGILIWHGAKHEVYHNPKTGMLTLVIPYAPAPLRSLPDGVEDRTREASPLLDFFPISLISLFRFLGLSRLQVEKFNSSRPSEHSKPTTTIQEPLGYTTARSSHSNGNHNRPD